MNLTGTRPADNQGRTTVNNGDQLTLTVTMPAGAQSGNWATIVLVQNPMSSSDSGDSFHRWFVGVFVP